MKKVLNTILENGIIISLALGMAYLLSYKYQEGFLDTYGVPLEFIKINMIDVVKIFAISLGALYFVLMLFNSVLNIFTGITDYKLYHIVRMLLLCCTCAGFDILIFNKLFVFSTIFGAAFLIYLLIHIVAPMICYREKISYLQKWSKHSDKLLERDRETIQEYNQGHFKNAKKTTSKTLLCVCIIYVLSTCFNMAGQRAAETKTEYYIADNYQEKVVVYLTDEYYVLMDFKDKGNKKTYQVVSVEDIGILSLKKIEPFEKQRDE